MAIAVEAESEFDKLKIKFTVMVLGLFFERNKNYNYSTLNRARNLIFFSCGIKKNIIYKSKKQFTKNKCRGKHHFVKINKTFFYDYATENMSVLSSILNRMFLFTICSL